MDKLAELTAWPQKALLQYKTIARAGEGAESHLVVIEPVERRHQQTVAVVARLPYNF